MESIHHAHPIYTAGRTLSPDVLPVIKIRHYAAQKEEERVYCYARLWVEEEALRLLVTCFERNPSPDSAVTLVLAAAPRPIRWLAAVCSHSEQGKLLLSEEGSVPLALRSGKGVDEQGWYWQAEATITKEILSCIGVDALFQERILYANLFRTSPPGPLMGVAYKAGPLPIVPGPYCLSPMRVLPPI